MSDELAQDRAIAQALPRTWAPFFDRFGRLTPVQRAAIPPLLNGQDVLISAATAAGKTEAACAPLLERLYDARRPWTILYVTPTRALANDLFARLEGPVQSLGLKLQLRTGDHRTAIGQPPHLLITTPESMDSILCRGRLDGPPRHVLAGVAAVVLDEVHLLHGSPRGEQVAWLLTRLRRLRGQAGREGWAATADVQVVGLSATLADPEAVRDQFLPGGAIVTVAGSRSIQVLGLPEPASVLTALPAYLAERQKPEKVLVFANTRRRADELGFRLRALLEPAGYPVWVHHGSLSRGLREEAEAAIRRESRAVLVATSTLEIGIDVGNIDLVVLDGPTPGVAEFLQRIGRGNRRSGECFVLCCGEAPADGLLHAALQGAAVTGWMGPVTLGPQWAVARQQIASYLFQSPKNGRTREQILGLLAERVPGGEADLLLQHLIAAGELKLTDGVVRLGSDWVEASVRGEIHSVLEVPRGTTLVDQATGRTLAEGLLVREGARLQVGGQWLEAGRLSGRQMEVRRIQSDSSATGQWGYVGRGTPEGVGRPAAVRRLLGLSAHEWPVLGESGRWFVFHGGGERRALALALAATAAGEKGLRANGWFLVRSSPERPGWLDGLAPGLLAVGMQAQVERLEGRLGRPMANRRLPTHLRLQEVEAWLDLPAEVQALRDSVWVSVEDGMLRERLLSLLAGLAPR